MENINSTIVSFMFRSTFIKGYRLPQLILYRTDSNDIVPYLNWPCERADHYVISSGNDDEIKILKEKGVYPKLPIRDAKLMRGNLIRNKLVKIKLIMVRIIERKKVIQDAYRSYLDTASGFIEKATTYIDILRN